MKNQFTSIHSEAKIVDDNKNQTATAKSKGSCIESENLFLFITLQAIMTLLTLNTN